MKAHYNTDISQLYDSHINFRPAIVIIKTIFVSIIMVLTQTAISQTLDFQPVKIIRDDSASKIDIYIGEKFFTSFIFKSTIEKPILYPICAANGAIVTRGFPLMPRTGERIDHPHQIGMWFTFGDVNGLDFWNNSYAVPENLKKKYGRINLKKISEISSSGVSGKLVVDLEWVDYLGNVLLNEETAFIFSGNENLRFIERISKLYAGNNKVIFGDSKEGLMGIRVARAFETPSNEPLIYADANGKPTKVAVMDNTGVNGLYRSSSGFAGDSVWGTRNKWVILTAQMNNCNISLAFFDHPGNPGYPAHAHARGYGLFALNNFGQHAFRATEPVSSFELKAKDEMTFKYLFVVKSGKEMTNEDANNIFSVFERGSN